MPFGTLPMGALAEAFGAPVAVAAGGLTSTLLVLIITLRVPALRRMSPAIEDTPAQSVTTRGAH